MVSLTKRAPVDAGPSQFSGLLRRMFNEPMLDDPFFRPMLASAMSWAPAMEVSETNDAITLTAELPGLDEKAIRISIENNVLTIAGEKEQETTDGPPTTAYYMTERFYGAFQRSFTLPRTVDVERVKADFEKGVLTVTLPKLPQAKGKTIEIGAKT
jgi:HSP20 family protein